MARMGFQHLKSGVTHTATPGLSHTVFIVLGIPPWECTNIPCSPTPIIPILEHLFHSSNLPPLLLFLQGEVGRKL